MNLLNVNEIFFHSPSTRVLEYHCACLCWCVCVHAHAVVSGCMGSAAATAAKSQSQPRAAERRLCLGRWRSVNTYVRGVSAIKATGAGSNIHAWDKYARALRTRHSEHLPRELHTGICGSRQARIAVVLGSLVLPAKIYSHNSSTYNCCSVKSLWREVEGVSRGVRVRVRVLVLA